MFERLMIVVVIWLISLVVFRKAASAFFAKRGTDDDLGGRFFDWVAEFSTFWLICFVPALMPFAIYFALRAKPRRDEVEEEEIGAIPSVDIPVVDVALIGDSVDPNWDHPCTKKKPEKLEEHAAAVEGSS